jgi:hypothetical protein
MSLISFEGAMRQVLEEGYRVTIQEEDGDVLILIDKLATVDTPKHCAIEIIKPTFEDAIEAFRIWA